MCAQTTSFGFTELIRFYFHPQLFSPAPGLWLLSQLDSGGRDKRTILHSSNTPIINQSLKSISQTSPEDFPPSLSRKQIAGAVAWPVLWIGHYVLCYVIHVGGLGQPGVPHPLSNLWWEFIMLHEWGFCNTLPATKGNTDKKSQVLIFVIKKMNCQCSLPQYCLVSAH